MFNNAITASAAPLTTSRVSVHDPSIVKANGKYYLFGTHVTNAVSSNLTSWSYFQTNTDYAKVFSIGGNWASHGSSTYNINGNLWAPDVIYNPTMKKWCMYMSVNGDKFYSSIALATADNIEGPYTYAGTIVYSGFVNSSQASETDYKTVTGTTTVDSKYLSNGAWNSFYGPNAIDPCLLYDTNGNLWISYGSWFGGIFMLKLNTSTGLRDYSYTYQTIPNVSDKYFGTKISGGYGTTGEGSYIKYDKSSGYYYLYESYCGLDATDNFSGYHIRLFRSKNITGPYVDARGNSAICTSANDDKSNKGIKLFGNYSFSSLSSVASFELSSKGYMSGGHNSALIDDSGQRYLVYHTRFNNGTEGHQVRVHQQFLNEDGWPVTAVYEYLGSTISSSGYPINDIVGTYEFVNHGLNATTAYTGMLKTSKVSLNSNGTITGDYTGTWKTTSGSYFCTMVINNVTYKGVFFKQYNESAAHTDTMTFSLIGSNNESIWGSKVNSTAIVVPTPIIGANIADGTVFMLKNKTSNLYMEVQGGTAANGTNVQQWGASGSTSHNTWRVVSAGDGYYRIYSQLSDGKTYLLDVASGKSDNGTNIQIYSDTNSDAQLFKFVDNGDGTYTLVTKASQDRSCVEVINASTASGANVQEWQTNGNNCQKWILEKITTVLYGDINKDRNINSIDFALLKKYIIGESTFSTDQLTAADMNKDGSVNSLDFALLKKQILSS